MKKPFVVLAIDTSCDETSVAVTVNDRVISNVISSQVELHKKWGGVVPIIAKRAHEERIGAVIAEALKRFAQNSNNQIPNSKQIQNSNDQIFKHTVDAIAVTIGPGLAPALEVGIRKAKELSETYHKPLIPVNHMEGHLLSSFAKNSNGSGGITNVQFPLLGLLISGGHTELILMKNYGSYEKLGETLDDAVGEAFDKVAKMLDLGYPGGPITEQLAKDGDETAFNLPIPMRKRHDKGLDFSYSGIKTALFYLTNSIKEKNGLDKKTIQDLAASFQRVVTLSLIDKLELAVEQIHPKGILLGGGVISNLYIRNSIRKAMKKYKLPVYIPYSKLLFTDNAAMIGVCAYLRSVSEFPIPSIKMIDRDPNLSF